MEELPQHWKQSIIIPVCEKGDKKIDCSNYRGLSLLPAIYIILSITLDGGSGGRQEKTA
jgi:hypothetical protein